MKEREAGSRSGDITTRSDAQQWQSGYWWRCRHLHVPVIVWIVASVLGGAAIGSALEPDAEGDKAPTTTEVVVEQEAVVDARAHANDAACVPVADDVDCVGTDADVDTDVDGTSYRAEPGRRRPRQHRLRLTTPNPGSVCLR